VALTSACPLPCEEVVEPLPSQLPREEEEAERQHGEQWKGPSSPEPVPWVEPPPHSEQGRCLRARALLFPPLEQLALNAGALSLAPVVSELPLDPDPTHPLRLRRGPSEICSCCSAGRGDQLKERMASLEVKIAGPVSPRACLAVAPPRFVWRLVPGSRAERGNHQRGNGVSWTPTSGND